MTQALAGFTNIFGYAFSSTENRVELRNIRQGGNDFLAAVPLALQSMWAGMLMSEIAAVVSSPLYAIAQFFRIVFSAPISFPLSIFSCAVKEGFYESSVKAKVAPMTKFYELAEEVQAPVQGTVSLLVEGKERHFRLGNDLSWYIRSSFEENGKRYRFHRLQDGEIFDDQCREIEIDGVMTRIKLCWERPSKNFIQIKHGDQTNYYEIGNEVDEPIASAITVQVPFDQIDRDNPVWQRYHRLREIPHETEDCIKASSQEMSFSFNTGKEINTPTDTSYSFEIDGTLRHFATAKYVQYPAKGLSGWINQITQHFFNCSILSTRLSQITATALMFINQNLSNIIRVAITAAGLALLYFGQMGMAAGALAAVAYEYLDHDLGVIPQKISLFMERWMPTISMVGLLITGSLFTQMIAGTTLLLSIPQVQLFIHQKAGKLIRKAMIEISEQLIAWSFRDERRPPDFDKAFAQLKAFPHLEEIDAPFVQRREMTAREIEEILDDSDVDYELNPALLSKSIEPRLQLDEDHDFQKLIELWDRLKDVWITPAAYERIVKRLADDKRFILFLQESFPETKRFYFEYDDRNEALNKRQQYQAAWNRYLLEIKGRIELLAAEKEVTKEQFVANWAREQFDCYLGKITCNRPIEGEQRYLQDAIENTSKILPFLTDETILPVYLEDALLKLAIEGGDYCSLAMRRASNEVLQGFTASLLQEIENQLPENERIEHQVMQMFQKERFRAMQEAYYQATRVFKEKEQLQDVADDIHLYMAISRSIKRGFYPMTEDEMARFSILELLLTETALLVPRTMLNEEFMERIIPNAMNTFGIDPENILRNRCLDYLRAWVQENPQLTEREKTAFLNNALSTDNVVANPGFYPKWHRLMLTILGIYRKKPVQIPASVTV